MGYDLDFYDSYSEYLVEEKVRKAHDRIFNFFKANSCFRKVVDFGCGQFNEFFKYGKPKEYVGIDKEVETSRLGNKKLMKADYRNSKDLSNLIEPFEPTSFVSLFSSEIIDNFKDNYKFYEKIFNEIPSIKTGLVSGFFYSNKKNINPIEEAGGLISYQTLEEIEKVPSNFFKEMRILIHVSSKMFGKDVFEVWKFFERK